jgi:hypothetical protein
MQNSHQYHELLCFLTDILMAQTPLAWRLAFLSLDLISGVEAYIA